MQNLMDDVPVSLPAGSKKFMHQLRLFIRSHNKSWATEKTYRHWVKGFIHFNGDKHPKELGARAYA